MKNSLMDGLLITLEGIDLSGKSTQLRMLADHLRDHHRDVVALREPGGTTISDKIRAILLDAGNVGMSEIPELLLYVASRAQLTREKIIPAINRGKIVICDRFADSSLAYQGYGRGIPLDDVRRLNQIATFGIKPSITFLLDITVDEAVRRRKARTEMDDRIEKEAMEFHEKVRNGYMEILSAEPERVVRIDANRKVEKINSRF